MVEAVYGGALRSDPSEFVFCSVGPTPWAQRRAHSTGLPTGDFMKFLGTTNARSGVIGTKRLLIVLSAIFCFQRASSLFR
jgi:hypothetical protein